jgi:hypothetical protein
MMQTRSCKFDQTSFPFTVWHTAERCTSPKSFLIGSKVVRAKWRVTICPLAATNKCLAKRNKSRMGAKATKNRSTGEKQ